MTSIIRSTSHLVVETEMVTVTSTLRRSPEAAAELLLIEISKKACADRHLRHLCEFPPRDNKPNDVLDFWVNRNVVSILKKDHAEVCVISV